MRTLILEKKIPLMDYAKNKAEKIRKNFSTNSLGKNEDIEFIDNMIEYLEKNYNSQIKNNSLYLNYWYLVLDLIYLKTKKQKL